MGKRWSERISDLEKSLARLAEAIEDSKKIELSTLKDGVIQRFEFVFELSWKALKIYINSEGIAEAKSPKSTIREAFKMSIIKDGNIWVDMAEDRNLTSHTYEENMANNIYEKIVNKYFNELNSLYDFLKTKEIED